MQKLLIAVAFLCSSIASAHDFWIQPSNFTPAPNERVDFTLNVGGDFSGDVLPRVDEWFSRFEVYDAFGHEPVSGELGDDPAGYIEAGPHSALIIYRSTRNFVELHPGKFETYLEDEGLEWVTDYRKSNGLDNTWGKEWFSRCAKVMIRPKGSELGPEVMKSTDMTLEIIPLEDPYSLDKSGYLPVKILYLGKPLVGAQVIAYSASNTADKLVELTDDSGIANFYLTHTDQWLIKSVHIIRTPDTDKKANWESFWASLTFQTQIQ